MKIIINNTEVNLTSENGKVFATSLDVAKVFEKEHRNILRDIKNMNDRVKPNFELKYYLSKNNKQMPMYSMNRDGFIFLVMSFTGTKAEIWKLDFIEAFNKMEETIKTTQSPHNFTMQSIISMAQNLINYEKKVDEISEKVYKLESVSAFTSADSYRYLNAVNKKVEEIQKKYPKSNKPALYGNIHGAVKSYYKVASYKDLPHYKIDEILSLVDGIFLSVAK